MIDYMHSKKSAVAMNLHVKLRVRRFNCMFCHHASTNIDEISMVISSVSLSLKASGLGDITGNFEVRTYGDFLLCH